MTIEEHAEKLRRDLAGVPTIDKPMLAAFVSAFNIHKDRIFRKGENAAEQVAKRKDGLIYTPAYERQKKKRNWTGGAPDFQVTQDLIRDYSLRVEGGKIVHSVTTQESAVKIQSLEDNRGPIFRMSENDLKRLGRNLGDHIKIKLNA